MNLSFFYPHAHTSPPWWQTACATLLLLLITTWRCVNNHRYLAVGWLWFLGTLVPMIQLVQVGNHAMADRYAYLPFIGLFIADLLGGCRLGANDGTFRESVCPLRPSPDSTAGSFATRRQLNYWTDDLTLWTHSSQAVKNNAMAEELIGETLLEKHDPEDAIAHFRAAEAMDPLFPFPYLHVGIYEEDHGQPRWALEQFQQVIDAHRQCRRSHASASGPQPSRT